MLIISIFITINVIINLAMLIISIFIFLTNPNLETYNNRDLYERDYSSDYDRRRDNRRYLEQQGYQNH